MTDVKSEGPRTPRSGAKVQVLSCRCIVRTYDGKVVVANADCKRHHVHPDVARAE